MKDVSLADLRTQLRGAGLRATTARLAVLRHLIEHGAPVTHGDVAERLGVQGIDRATVYRNLMDLTEAGLARRTDVGDHVWRFELLAGGRAHAESEHPHFICSQCGVVECLPGDAVQVKPVRGLSKAARRRGVQIQVRGVCSSCE